MTSSLTILITGASAGFGKEMALTLAELGHTIIATARRIEKLNALRDKYKNIYPIQLDIRDIHAVREFPQRLPNALRNIDVLINNAGLALGIAPAQEANPDEWEDMISTNISGFIEITRAFLPEMVKRNKGYIISLGSTAAHYPYKGGNTYGATKAFVAQFMANLRTDLLGTNIRVTNIEPGLCGGTEFSHIRLKNAQKAHDVYKGTTPLTAQDIAQTVKWLIQLPQHVNINHIEMMPTCQAAGGLSVIRKS